MAIKKEIRVNLVLQGDLEEVMEVVAFAMAENLMKEYRVNEDFIPVLDAKEFMNPNRRRREFGVGDRVKFKGKSAKYGMNGGEVGTITKVFYSGRKSKVAVRWDDNTENEIGGSYLEIVKVAS